MYSRVWKMQIPYLSRHFRVVVYDGRGKAGRDRPDPPGYASGREQAADALAVLDATGTEQAVGSGSRGEAKWSLILAASTRSASSPVLPRRQASGSRASPSRRAVPVRRGEDTDEGWAKENRHYWLRDWQGYVEWFFSQCFTEPHSTKHIEDAVGWGLETTAETMILTEEAPELEPNETRELCTRLACPVLVVHGDEDAVVPHAQGVAIAEATGGRLVTFGGSGHCLQVRDPVRFNLVLRQFVESGA